MSLSMWDQRRNFYFNNSTFLHFLFFLIWFFYWWKIVWKGKTSIPLQEPYLMWCSSWGTTLIYSIPGLESVYVAVWYWKTAVKNKRHKNIPLLNKQTNKQQENPPEKVSFHSCWRLHVGLQFRWTVPFPVPLSTRLYFAFMSWTFVRKPFILTQMI